MTDHGLIETIGIASLGAVGLAFGIQKLLKSWKETSTESNIMDLMHEELERMAKLNRVLSDELAALQTEMVNLNREMRNLAVENQKLNSEIRMLNQEITRLQEMLSVTNGSNTDGIR